MFFKRKKDKYIDSKFKIDEFVGFHMNGDLKHGVIRSIKKENDSYLYDINVGGEASWIAYDIKEDKILKINK